MTSFPVREDQELSDVMSAVIPRLGGDFDAVTAATELRSALTPGNGYSTPAVPYGAARGAIAAALRSLAGEEHPAAEKIRGLAAGLADQQLPTHLRR